MSGFRPINGRWVIDKAVASQLDYGIRLRRWLAAGDGVTGNDKAVWTVSDGLQKVSSQVVQDAGYGPIAYVRLKGGVLRAQEWARCVWTTDLGQVEQQTLFFNIVDK